MQYYSRFIVSNLILLSLAVCSNAQKYATWEEHRLVLDNGLIRREIVHDPETGQILTRSLKLKGDQEDFLNQELISPEFSVRMGGQKYSGLDPWLWEGVTRNFDDQGGDGAILRLRGTGELENVFIELCYLLYKDLPVISKFITVSNESRKDMRLEAVDVENLRIKAFTTDADLYVRYCRQKHIGPYVGNWNDPAVAIQMITDRRGMIIGNEAPGVLKRIAYYQERDDITAGLTHPDQPYPFRKWIEPGNDWDSPETFLLLYDDADDPHHALNYILPDYLRKHMGLRIHGDVDRPVFVYNIWYPFFHDINQELVEELIEAAAKCGVEQFIIDDGWMVNEFTDKEKDETYTHVGDYIIDTVKFPNGLEPHFERMHELGMKSGLWLSVGSANYSARVYREHPEWFVRGPDGELTNLHSTIDKGMLTACFSTGWFDHINNILLRFAEKYDLSYTKLDFAVVTSAYVTDPALSGCYARDHPLHRDHPESFLMNYRRLFELFDRLHREVPDLFIDCTFETQGKLHLIDYGFMKHADGNWLSNFQDPVPTGALRVRWLAWSRTPVMPAAACLVGNLPLDSKDLEFDYLSTIGTFPIMLGDARKVNPEQRKMLKDYTAWLRDMKEKYNYMDFRQDLYGFGEPREGYWDGWQRINTETREGGIIGVFRQGALESKRRVTIGGLNPDARYSVLKAVSGDEVIQMSGKELRDTGVVVEMEKPYQGKLFQIHKLD